MSYKSSKWFLLTSAMIAPSLVVLYLSFFAFSEDAARDRLLGETQAEDRLVPPSRAAIPLELADRAEIETREFLKFFKTPTQQLMPLGFYAMAHDMRNVQVLSRLRRHGINLFHKYFSEQPLKDALNDLSFAREAGVGVLQNLPRAYINTRGPEFWRRHISGLADNDQILAWYLPEEARKAQFDELEMIRGMIRASDRKKRPIISYVVEWHEDYLKQISSMVDALVFGFYPCHNGVRPRAEIKRRLDHAHKCGVPIVLASLEAFEGKYRWPSPEEIRFDAYLALASGAKGIMWYAYAYAKQRPEILEAVLQVATQLNGPERLGEVLLLGKEPELLICRTVKGRQYWHDAYEYGTSIKKREKINSIQWTAREYCGYLYIFAVNVAQKTVRPFVIDPNANASPEYDVTVTFDPISSGSSEVRVIGEDRNIKLADGHLIDTFRSLETHIYKIAQE